MRKSMRTYISRRISFFLAVLFLTVSVYSVSTRAASPEIKVINTTSMTGEGVVGEDGLVSITDISVKTIVAHLKITDLEIPQSGQKFDTRATVLSYDGYFWEIPVIWVDESGTVSYICLPGKNYRPVFAYYIPKNVVVANDIGTNSYTIELPEFLDGIISDSNVLMVGSEAYGITFITTGDLTDVLTSTNNGTQPISSLFVSNEDITSFFEDGQKKIISNLVDELVPIDSDTETSTEESTYQQDDTSEENVPVKPVKDYVSIHCSQNAIDNIGADKLQSLLDLIINVIEPQAVYQLNSGFSSYASGCKEKLLGDEIGLYVYDSEFDSGANDYDGAAAYVFGKYLDDEVSDYGYYMGINVKSLYSKDEESGTYNLNTDELVNLNNTIVHEMMHAYMDDYNRTGMAGVVSEGSDILPEDNIFPSWFVEGIATTVDNVYTYHDDVFDAMIDTELKRYTNDSLYSYYTNYDDEKNGKASIDSTNKYYDADKNTASAYVSGYLAVMYLANMANIYSDSGTDLINYYDDGTYYYESKAIRLGLDYLLEELHDGTCLDEIISQVSEGKYTSTQDFQNAFLTVDSEGNYDDSYDFCRGLLNYLNFATGVVSQSDPEARANGSVLLPFDTQKTSVIENSLPEGIGEQTAYVINDEMSFVSSTVDNEVALSSAGVKESGRTDESDSEIIDQELSLVARADNTASEKTQTEETKLQEPAPDDILIENESSEVGTEQTDAATQIEGGTGAESDNEIAESTDTENAVSEDAVTDDTSDEITNVQDEVSELPREDEPVDDIVDDLENTTYLIDTIDQQESGSSDIDTETVQDEDSKESEEKETILLPSLIDTEKKVGEAIEEPGIPDTALETLSEAVAPPAPNGEDDNNETKDDEGGDDEGGDGDSGDGDSGNDDGTDTLDSPGESPVDEPLEA